MVHLFRVICLALGFCFVSSAFAFSKQSQWFASPYPNDFFASAEEACAAALVKYGAGLSGFTVKYIGVTGEPPNNCAGERFKGGDSYGKVNFGLSSTSSCPANSTEDSSGNCTCNKGYFERKTGTSISCVKPDDRSDEQKCEDLALLWNSTLTPDRSGRVKGRHFEEKGIVVCHDTSGGGTPLAPGMGCKHRFTGDFAFVDDDGQKWTNGFSVALDKNDLAEAGGSLSCSLNGSDTDPTKPPKDNKPPSDCVDGYKGQVNGVDVCIEAWTRDTEGVDWTRTRDAQGNDSTTQTNITCKGDQCTVKETTTRPDGTTTTTVTDNVNRQTYCARNPESSICGRKDDVSGGDKGPATRGNGNGHGDGFDKFCEKNPDSPMCKKSSFGGACSGGFSCDGDAVQCAIAKEQHLRNCKLFEDKSTESDLYEQHKGKEGNQTNDLPGNETVDLNGRIDTSDALGGGSCIQDMSVQVYHSTVLLPISRICSYLSALGNVMLALSFLIALRTVGRG